MRFLPLMLLVLWASVGVLPAEEAPGGKLHESRLESMKGIIDPLQRTAEEIDNLRQQLKKAGTAEAKEGIQARLLVEQQRLDGLRQNFLDIIGGAEAAEYEGASNDGLTLNQQLVDLLQPLLGALREASSGPRELEQLKAKLDVWNERKRKADVIIKRIDAFDELVKNKQLKDELLRARKHWEGMRAEAVGQIGVIGSQIDEREMRRRPVWESISSMFSRFFRSRGLNLLMAVLAGVLGFVVVRRGYTLICRYSPLHRTKRQALSRRIADISAAFLSVVVAVWAVMMVFYLRGDWLLLTLVALMLVGAAWAAKQSLPPYIDQIRTLLNLGSIREGERVIYEGLPWQVKAISFLSTLENPNLQGGVLRIPIRYLMGMISRDPDPKEPWFPTHVDDWVLVDNELFGKVVTQTPEQVVILQLGGALVTYPSAEFLMQKPQNLSCGFRVSCRFGIDYRHQAVSTTEVPEIMQRSISEVLHSTFDRDSLHAIRVELTAAGASSLDYQINVDVAGCLASRYQSLHRLVQKICVDTCNEQGWVIPFTQITIHHAADGEPAKG